MVRAATCKEELVWSREYKRDKKSGLDVMPDPDGVTEETFSDLRPFPSHPTKKLPEFDVNV